MRPRNEDMMQDIEKSKHLLKCQRGSIAVIAALAISALIVGAGIAVDFGTMLSKRTTSDLV